jgi:hypothetical protein
VLRFDEATKILWIDAESIEEARRTYHGAQLEPIRELRGIVIRMGTLFRMIRSREDVIEFVTEPMPSLGAMMATAMDAEEPSRVEIAIYCERTGCVCFAWKDGQSLTLWKTETQPGENETAAAFRLMGELIPAVSSDSMVSMWTSKFDGETVHFFITYVEQEYEIDQGIWIKPSALSSFRLDRTMSAAFINAPSLARLIRRSPA